MWRKVVWGLRALALLIAVLFLHYTLPQRDVVQILNTYNKLTPIGANRMFYASEDTGAGAGTGQVQRDIRFIEAVYPDGRSVMVYRNEDTGWLWPPYFKWDSGSLQAQASNYRSERSNPQWVVVTHYGWRIPFLSVYPNALRIRPVAGPDVTLFPWLNLAIIALLVGMLVLARLMWLQFRERVIGPAFDRIGAEWRVATAGLRRRLARPGRLFGAGKGRQEGGPPEA